MKRCENTDGQMGFIRTSGPFVPLLLVVTILAFLWRALPTMPITDHWQASGAGAPSLPGALSLEQSPVGRNGTHDLARVRDAGDAPAPGRASTANRESGPARAVAGSGSPGQRRVAGAAGNSAGSNSSSLGNRIEGVDSRQLIAWLYRNFFGKDGDPHAIDLWASLIDAGTFSPEQAVETFLDSAHQYRGVAPVARLYFATFLRPPDYDGLAHWRDAVFTGATLEQIGERIAGSPEFTARYGNLDDASFIDRAYQNAFGREPTDGERMHWRLHLGPDAASRGRMMVSLSESEAFRQSAGGAVDVVMLYAGLLGRAADSPGFTGWMDFLAQGDSRQALIRGFLSSAEFRERLRAATPAGVH